MVIGGDSKSEGHGFKSEHHILDFICGKNCNFCLKRRK